MTARLYDSPEGARPAPRGGPAGDLYLHLRVRPHSSLHRDGFDLRTALRVTMAQAALGAQLKVETLDGPEELTVPPGCPTGFEIRIRSRGVPHLQRRGRGDLLVTVVVETPTDLTPSQEELLRRFAAERGEDVAPPEAGLFSRIRSAFNKRGGKKCAGWWRTPSSRTSTGRPSRTGSSTISHACCASVLGKPYRSPTVEEGHGCASGWETPSNLWPSRPGSPSHDPLLTVGFALTKGEHPEGAVQKLTEAGADRVVIMVTDRCVARWRPGSREPSARAAARGGAAGRHAEPSLMAAIGGRAVPFSALIRGEGGQAAGELALAVQGGAPLTLRTPTVLVGPEGGWTRGRAASVPEGRQVALGPNVLRAETAAVAAGVLLAALRLGLVRRRGPDDRRTGRAQGQWAVARRLQGTAGQHLRVTLLPVPYYARNQAERHSSCYDGARQGAQRTNPGLF